MVSKLTQWSSPHWCCPCRKYSQSGSCKHSFRQNFHFFSGSFFDCVPNVGATNWFDISVFQSFKSYFSSSVVSGTPPCTTLQRLGSELIIVDIIFRTIVVSTFLTNLTVVGSKYLGTRFEIASAVAGETWVSISFLSVILFNLSFHVQISKITHKAN